MKSTNQLTVHQLAIDRIGGDAQEVYDHLTKITECSVFCLSFAFTHSQETIPYLSFVKSLYLHKTGDIKEALFSYSHTLQHLSLTECTITDVSMLGSIPRLGLHYCDEIVDISALNNNDHIVIRYCNGIKDFSQSFANSKKIEIALMGGTVNGYRFDMTKWMKVEDMRIEPFSTDIPIYFQNSYQLPKTIKKCYLTGSAVTDIDFTVTTDHIVKELTLSNDDSIESLEGYGLNRVQVLEVDGLSSLQSLRGLGNGKNQKVMIRDCDQVADFSPLSHIPIVEIRNCYFFTDPSQIRDVRYLTIALNRDIKFKNNHPSINPYENIHSLTLLNMQHIKDFSGLGKIPELTFGFIALESLNKFLRNESPLENQHIILMDCMYNLIHLQNLHQECMKDHYDNLDQLPKKWSWIRKSV